MVWIVGWFRGWLFDWFLGIHETKKNQVYCVWLSKGLLCLYILKKWRFGQLLWMPDRQTTEYSATQLVLSIKFKLSHAIELILMIKVFFGHTCHVINVIMSLLRIHYDWLVDNSLRKHLRYFDFLLTLFFGAKFLPKSCGDVKNGLVRFLFVSFIGWLVS